MKSEVYSWRVDADVKSALEEAARGEGTSMAQLLDRIVNEWLRRSRDPSDDEAEQRRLHAEAARCIGRIHGGDPKRSREVSKRVRAKLSKKSKKRDA
ncbi:MAG: hypothetical protein ACYTGZ_05545 [Planctomycetota bacterium]|jgi:hypothetical protein